VNGIGSTRQLSNDSQSVTQTTTYDAFGNVESSAGSSNNVYRYAGQWGYRNDGDDGLMHVGARYYDALVGRFISADTYLGDIGNPQSLNRYAYVESDPVNHVDPTGYRRRKSFPVEAAVIGGTGVATIGAGAVAGTTTTTTTTTTTVTTVTASRILWGLFTKTVTTTTVSTATSTVGAGTVGVVAGGAMVVVGGAMAAYGGYKLSDWWVNNTSSGDWVTTKLGNLIYAITDGR
jgi:RHS repeat-associated protein